MINPEALHGVDFTGPMDHEYLLSYDVPADTVLEAVERAAVLLRSDVHLIALHEAAPTGNGYWHVTLKVWEAA